MTLKIIIISLNNSEWESSKLARHRKYQLSVINGIESMLESIRNVINSMKINWHANKVVVS